MIAKKLQFLKMILTAISLCFLRKYAIIMCDNNFENLFKKYFKRKIFDNKIYAFE